MLSAVHKTKIHPLLRKRNAMKEYYHITLLKNFNSIMTYGLIPQKGLVSKKHGNERTRIYLFQDIKDMDSDLIQRLITDIKTVYGDGTELCILKLKLPNHFHIKNSEKHEKEFYTTDVISPKYISYYREIE